MKKKVDWTKKPEIRWEKRLCPICNEPTGEMSRCHDPNSKRIFDSADEDSPFPKTIEVNGDILPLFSPQCAFRKINDFMVFVNFPITYDMADSLGSIDGVEKILVKSPYRMFVTIAEQFDETQIKQQFNKAYRDHISEKAQENEDKDS